MDDMEKMENDNIIVLTDEDGIDVEFEFCALCCFRPMTTTVKS